MDSNSHNSSKLEKTNSNEIKKQTEKNVNEENREIIDINLRESFGEVRLIIFRKSLKTDRHFLV